MIPLLRAVRDGRRRVWFVHLASGGVGVAGTFERARELARGFRWLKQAPRRQGERA